MKRHACIAALFAASLLSVPAFAGPDDARTEAGERFSRAIRLFNEGDNTGSLAEFRRANELVPNVPVVLYNIGLVYAVLNRPVEATDALDKALASATGLKPEQRARGERTREEQAARIGELAVSTNVDGAVIEVDGVEVARAPLAAPLRVSSGTHLVGAVAAGHAPARKEVSVAGRAKASVELALVPMEGRLAHLAVKTHLPAAEIFIDGQRVGDTPLAASLTLAPGAHEIELRRSGYVTARRSLTLGDGAQGEVALEPEEDRAALAQDAGLLALEISETQPTITIDGVSRGAYAGPIRLARGTHRLLVERGDFEPYQRDVLIEPQRTTQVRVPLEPVPAYRSHYASAARAQRTWGWIAVVGGAALAGAGVGLFVYDAGKRSDGNAALAQLAQDSVRFSGRRCDPAQSLTDAQQAACEADQASAQGQISDANTRDIFAYVGMAAGAAAMTVGVVLLVTNNDVHRYDAKPTEEMKVRIVPTVWTARGGGGVGLIGAF